MRGNLEGDVVLDQQNMCTFWVSGLGFQNIEHCYNSVMKVKTGSLWKTHMNQSLNYSFQRNRTNRTSTDI